VAPEFRGLGIARTLLAAGLREALTDARIEQVQLCVRGDNSRALGLYQSLGFKKQQDMVAMRLEKQGHP
jgi:ribosomal protein S18 acetylase RimI-like enzyme